MDDFVIIHHQQHLIILLIQVEGTSSVVYELAKLATQEQMLLDQSRDLLSTVAAIHVRRISSWFNSKQHCALLCSDHCVDLCIYIASQVKQCSLKTHMLQRKQRQGQTQW